MTSVYESPCIKVCVIDVDTDVCSGCHRSLAEIARWTQFSAAERHQIMVSLPARAQRTMSGAIRDNAGRERTGKA